MKLTTKQRIYFYLQHNGQVSGSELEKMADKWFTKPSVISRRARELAQAGTIERVISSAGTVQYRLKEKSRNLSTEQANLFLRTLDKPKQLNLM